MHERRNARGFTLIELLLVVAILGLIASVILIGQRSASATRRDVKRYADIKSLEQALSLYVSKTQAYPTYTGCIDGADPVTTALRAENVIAADTTMADPGSPSDPVSCYYYEGTASKYTVRYTIEVSSNAGAAGNHYLVP